MTGGHRIVTVERKRGASSGQGMRLSARLTSFAYQEEDKTDIMRGPVLTLPACILPSPREHSSSLDLKTYEPGAY